MDAPQLPLPVRLFNGATRPLRQLGLPLVSLDPEKLIAKASQKTGLRDGTDQRYREALDRLVRSLEEEACLSTLGRFIAQTDILRYLEVRLQLADWHTRHAEIGEGRIDRPIFIIGQGRTGTTILHELLMLDPHNRVPQTWEVDEPFPPPERASYDRDPRIESSQKFLDRSESLIPEFKKMHRMGAQLPQECIRITGIEFLSLIMTAQYYVPSYTRWLLQEADLAPAYAVHRRFLQLLQWHCPAERWVLKSPGHLWSLGAVLDEYPDALFVQTHRDPLKCVSSLSSLEVMLRGMASEHVLHSEVAQEWADLNALGFDGSVDFRESGRVDSSRFVDLHFGPFVADPVAGVGAIYEQFDLEFTPEFEQRMRDYIAANPSDRDGRHVHSFAATGLDVAIERSKVRRYVEYFDVQEEPV